LVIYNLTLKIFVSITFILKSLKLLKHKKKKGGNIFKSIFENEKIKINKNIKT
jgi:hypothetical protein